MRRAGRPPPHEELARFTAAGSPNADVTIDQPITEKPGTVIWPYDKQADKQADTLAFDWSSALLGGCGRLFGDGGNTRRRASGGDCASETRSAHCVARQLRQ